MKKPEFPQSQVFNDSFLPEQDPLMNYRIKKVTKPDGKEWFYPQKKFLWFWMTIDNGGGVVGGGYGSESWAQAIVFRHYNRTLKDKVEYLEVRVTSKTVPNPPPRHP